MPLIDLAKGDFGSFSKNVPRMKLSNMYLIENPVSISGFSYVVRPSLSLFATVSGNTRGIFYQTGNGNSTTYVVVDNNLFKLLSNGTTTLIGATPGTDICKFSSTIYYVAILSGGALFLYDGTSLTSVTIPDGQTVSDVTSLDNYLIFSIKNSNKFYWIEPGQTIVNPLNFISAERNPDDIISVITIGDELWTIGQETVEVFTDTGDANAPFQRISGRVYLNGCADKNSVTKSNKNSLPCLIWVTPTKEVILSQGVPVKISNESIEELLKLSTTFTAWSFKTNKHDFYVLTTDNETIVYDITLNTWYRWSSFNKNIWNGVIGIQAGDTIYSFNPSSANIYTLTTNPVDITSDYIICEITGFITNATNGVTPCNSVTLFVNYGYSPSYTSTPIIELRFSDNGASTWSPYYSDSLGLKGDYDATIRFRSLGSFNRPGRYFEFRFSDIANFRLDGVVLNDTI